MMLYAINENSGAEYYKHTEKKKIKTEQTRLNSVYIIYQLKLQ